MTRKPPLRFERIARDFKRTLLILNSIDMKEKNVVLEWTAIEGSKAAELDKFVFVNRGEVRR